MAGLTIRSVAKMPIEMQAIDALRDAIVNGSVAPGERITEIQISEQMNLSRATVRSALHQLAKEGLLSLTPYTGWRVVSMTPDDVWELYTLRSAIERLAAQLVASSIDEAGKARLKKAMAELEAACKRGDPAEADFALHKTIIDMTGHSRLIAQYGLIEQQIRMYIRSSDALVESGETIMEQHKPIVEAILAGAADAAGYLSEAHNMTEGKKLRAHVTEIGTEIAPASEEVVQPEKKGRRRKVAA